MRGVRWIADDGMRTRREILSGVDLSIESGERVGLVGRSGAGKTTLVTILAGLLEPSAGTVTWGAAAGGTGRPEPGSGAARQPPPAVGLVFQDPERGFFEESVLEDVAFGPSNAGFSDKEARTRAREALRTVGLEPDTFGPRAPETLSGGEARRAAIAGVLAFGPSLLVFDEPSSGLDAEGRDRLREILASLHERGIATLLVSHDLPLVLEECDRVLVLEQGRVAWEGPPAGLAEGAPRSWREDMAAHGGELVALAAALRARGLLAEDVPPTPAAMAEAVMRG
jgi:energy-coupling factor transporter ATP-binding protein EcfA2